MAWLAEIFQGEQGHKLEVFAAFQSRRLGIPNEAKDVLHDSYLEVLEGLVSGKFHYEGRSSLVGLMHRNMVFRFSNIARSLRREEPYAPGDLPHAESHSFSEADQASLVNEIVELIMKLPPAQQKLKIRQLLGQLFPGARPDFSRRDFEQLKRATGQLRYLRDFIKSSEHD